MDRCKIIMATLAELYEFLETKQDDSYLDSRFSYDAFLPVEQPKARLEILTWWKIERLIEDENCNFDKNFTVAYIYQTEKVTYKPKKWGFGVSAGYAFTGTRMQPYIGVGISYDLFQW